MQQEQDVSSRGLTVWREAQIMKDRSGLIDGMTFRNPTYEDFRPFVRYLIDAPAGAVQGESSSENLAPGENFESYDRKRKREIALEEIQEEIVRMYPGSSADMKQAKAALVEKLFNTRSWTAVENKPLSDLERARNTLWLESRGHEYGVRPPAQRPVLVPVDGASEPAAAPANTEAAA